jgi:hypothetical protein
MNIITILLFKSKLVNNLERKMKILIILLLINGSVFLIYPQSKWSKLIASTNYSYSCNDIIEFNNEFILCGTKNSAGVVIKVDFNGDIIKETIISGVDLIKICKIDTSNIVVFGQSFQNSSSQGRIICLDANLSIRWNKAYMAGNNTSYFRDGIILPNGNIIAFGEVIIETWNESKCNYWLLKTDSNGTKISTHFYGNGEIDYSRSIELTKDGDLILIGKKWGTPYIIKTSQDGQIIWEKEYKFNFNSFEIVETFGSYNIIGSINGRISTMIINNNNGDSVKLNLYEKGYGQSIIQLESNKYIVSANATFNFTNTRFDAYYFVTDSMGTKLKEFIFDFISYDYAVKAIKTKDEGLLFIGNTNSFWPYIDQIFIVKTDSNYLYNEITAIQKNKVFNTYFLYQNYPNPFNPKTQISYQIPNSEVQNVNLKVFDILGKEVATLVNEKQSPGNYQVEFDGTDYPSGVYFYRLQSGSYSETKKMILLR